MMPANDKGYVYSGHPTSFTGGGTTLTIPLGEITYETAKSEFADRFKGGMEAGQDLKAGFSAIVSPKVQDYSYEYNQLKNLGFAITPIVRCKLLLKVVNDDGSVKSEKLYESGDVEADAYMASLEPAEKISQLAHKVIYDLMVKAADNVLETLSSSSTSAGNSQ